MTVALPLLSVGATSPLGWTLRAVSALHAAALAETPRWLSERWAIGVGAVHRGISTARTSRTPTSRAEPAHSQLRRRSAARAARLAASISRRRALAARFASIFLVGMSSLVRGSAGKDQARRSGRAGA